MALCGDLRTTVVAVGPSAVSTRAPEMQVDAAWYKLWRLSTYVEAAGIVVVVSRQSLVSVLFAWLVNYVFTLGFVFSGQSPEKQPFPVFLAATMGNAVFFLELSVLVSRAMVLTRCRLVKKPHEAASVSYWFYRLMIQAVPHQVLVSGLTIGIAYVLGTASAALNRLQLHFYIGGLITHYYYAVIDAYARRLYQTETVEGAKERRTKILPMWKRIAHSYVNSFGIVFAVFTATIYIHMTSRLCLETQSALLVFSLASWGFRVSALKVVRYFVMKQSKVHVRTLYAITALPTVLINTQVRIALLRLQNSASLNNLILITLMEPVMRAIKVWTTRQEAKRLLQARVAVPSDGQYATSARFTLSFESMMKIAPVRFLGSSKGATREPSQHERDVWIHRHLHFVAAEIHADMCSEYIAIGCAMSIYYNFRHHPRFAWEQPGSQSAYSPTTLTSAPGLIGLQVLSEIGVDLIGSVWELVNGIPIQVTSDMNSYLVALFTGCAITNIAICCGCNVRAG